MGHTRFVPLCNVQIEASMSTRSPKLYPNAGPFEIAEATADLRKSMVALGEPQHTRDKAGCQSKGHGSAHWPPAPLPDWGSTAGTISRESAIEAKHDPGKRDYQLPAYAFSER
jgi:hypothetical protein